MIRRPAMLRLRLFAAASCVASSGTFAERVADSTFEYTFSREECLNGYATDTQESAVFGNLNINTSAVTCKGLGVEAKPGIRGDQRIVSTLNASRFAAEFDTADAGWTFETWATFQNFYDCPSCIIRHMLSIGSIDEDMVERGWAETSSISVLQENVEQSVAMRTSMGMATQYAQVAAGLVIEWGLPVHVVFTSTTEGTDASSTSGLAFSAARWYINGELAKVPDIDRGTVTWQGDFHLQLLNDAVAVRSVPAENAAPSGSVFLVAMYNRPLNGSEVAQNYDAGLAHSPPVAEDIPVTIWEDGEIGDHYDNPGLYAQDPMVSASNLSIISLLVVDMDQTEGFPGFVEGAENLVAAVFIDGLPSRGTLFDIDGQEITVIPHHVALDGGYYVRYRPEKDEYSGPSDRYTSFTYTAMDSVTGEPSVVPGVVDIYVLPKNDPPVPNEVSATVTTGGEHTIFLNGTDVDSSNGDTIEGAVVVALPTYGVLYQVFGNKTRSNVEVKSGDDVVGGYVSYVFNGSVSRASNASFGESLANDSFSFLLYDSLFALSTAGLASLEVVSGLKALTAQSQNDPSWVCGEDVESTIFAYAEDSSSGSANLTIVISAVPEHGSLLRVSTNNTLQPGDTLETKCSDGVPCVAAVRYQPEEDYFNSPNSRWNGDAVGQSSATEYFSFYAVAANGEYSSDAVQEIEVTNSNDPSGVQCPGQTQYVQAVGTSIYDSGGEFVPLDRAAIEGITIDDPDNGVDIVKIKISAGFGLLSLHQDYIGLLDFNSDTYCHDEDEFLCLGNGNSNHELIFFAEPHNVQMAFDGMTYQSVISDIVDTVNITVLDGANGDCLNEAKFRTESVRLGCLQLSCSFNVVVHGRNVVHNHVSNRDVPIQAYLSGGVSVCVLAYLVFWRCSPYIRRVEAMQ